jgi:hypothetical protein
VARRPGRFVELVGPESPEGEGCSFLRMKERYTAVSDYELQFLWEHLIAAHRFEDLQTVLLDFPYLQRKVNRGWVIELANDYRSALKTQLRYSSVPTVLSLLEETVPRNAQFLKSYPTMLFQSVWNTGWWYDSPDSFLTHEARD